MPSLVKNSWQASSIIDVKAVFAIKINDSMHKKYSPLNFSPLFAIR